ncbi:MAG: DedA family protein [Bacteroidales bacterium]|jgi:membrane protein YqaA with SNARE-associated domain|nr:DedA family protein [Bacteroidales bacterium]
MESLIKLGYLGLFIISFLAATIVPISPDVVMGGLIVLKYDLWTCIIVATVGNFLGGITTYGLGYIGKWEWVEKFFKKSKEDIDKFQHKIKKVAIIAAGFTWLPLVGDLIGLSLGFLRFKPVPVFLMMLVGRFVRFTVVGYFANIFLVN